VSEIQFVVKVSVSMHDIRGIDNEFNPHDLIDDNDGKIMYI